MEQRFLIHNLHLQYGNEFAQHDPQLKGLFEQNLTHKPQVISEMPFNIPGIYTLEGGRQVGKTTTVKLIISFLLEQKIEPERINFFTGELIDDHHSLFHLLQQSISSMPKDSLNYIFIDEITYIKDWDKAIKYAADSGLFEQVMIVLTGSDLVLMQEARKRFPGRRGKADKVDFHLHPLSFQEFILLKDYKKFLPVTDEKNKDISIDLINDLFNEFDQYIMHGGYLTAINDIAKHDRILPATFATYVDWIRGDMLKRGKQEVYLREILSAIIKCYGSQVTWNSLAHHLSIEHPATVADYINNLVFMDAAFIQSALLEDKLVAAPKKAKKIIFNDPFIYHSVKSWVLPDSNPYENQIKPILSDAVAASHLVEAIAVSHYKRFYPTYYIKAKGEVDIAYVKGGCFYPIEIKWRGQINYKDLKQIMKYENATIFSKVKEESEINGIKQIPLPLALARLGELPRTDTAAGKWQPSIAPKG